MTDRKFKNRLMIAIYCIYSGTLFVALSLRCMQISTMEILSGVCVTIAGLALVSVGIYRAIKTFRKYEFAEKENEQD